MGILPPLGQAEWEETFLLYQQYPEFKLINSSMSLDDFKGIFWFEYAHRVLGRSIGIIFLIPFLYFLAKKQVSSSLSPKLIALFVLGGLQGLMGWYMVTSGLVDDPHVSQYRLTAHLGLAIVIYAYMLWVALDLLFPDIDNSINTANQTLARVSMVISLLAFITVISGGFVAGTKAGYAYNTFPLMAGKLIPDGLFQLAPVWRNFFENVTLVQFNHRVLATILFVVIPTFWWIARRSQQKPRIFIALNLLLAAFAIQISLGITTLLLVVPVTYAAAHQGGAIVLLTVLVFLTHQLRGRTLEA